MLLRRAVIGKSRVPSVGHSGLSASRPIATDGPSRVAALFQSGNTRDMNDAHEIGDAVREVVLDGPALRLVIIFGSAAKGRLRPDSDIDIAILPVSEDLPLREEAMLAVRLEQRLGRSVDLVRLDHASTVLAWQIARDGVVAYASHPAEHPRFVAYAASEYADFAPALEAASRRFRERLAANS